MLAGKTTREVCREEYILEAQNVEQLRHNAFALVGDNRALSGNLFDSWQAETSISNYYCIGNAVLKVALVAG